MGASFQITVTLNDILTGKRYQPGECAIALAAKRALGNVEVQVTPAMLIVKGAEGPQWFALPRELRNLQLQFDTAPWDDFDRALGDDFKDQVFTLQPFVRKARTIPVSEEIASLAGGAL